MSLLTDIRPKPKPAPRVPKGKTPIPRKSEEAPAKEYPTEKTLEKYGLSRLDFRMLVEAQNGICPICEKAPSTGRWVIDHYHAKGWKKMSPEKRKMYVRGVTCWFCNHYYMGRAITIKKAENVADYLRKFENRLIQEAR